MALALEGGAWPHPSRMMRTRGLGIGMSLQSSVFSRQEKASRGFSRMSRRDVPPPPNVVLELSPRSACNLSLIIQRFQPQEPRPLAQLFLDPQQLVTLANP